MKSRTAKQEKEHTGIMVGVFAFVFLLMAINGLMHWTMDKTGVEPVTRDDAVVYIGGGND
jgi:hypothetical protein